MARIRNKLLQCWVTIREKKTMEKAAKSQHSSVSNWIRMELLNAAKRNGKNNT